MINKNGGFNKVIDCMTRGNTVKPISKKIDRDFISKS